MVDVGKHGHAVGDQRFLARAVTEIRGDRVGHLVETPAQRIAQAGEIVAALRGVGATGLPGGAQGVERRAQGVERGGGGMGVHRPESRESGRRAASTRQAHAAGDAANRVAHRGILVR